MPSLDFFFDLLQLAIKERTQLALENIALRQQLAVYKRSVKRPNINDGDRIFWMTIMRFLREWNDAVVIVKPETVVKWHRKGFKHYWRRKSRGKPGRPPISMALIHLIRRMSQENPTWGAPRIADELALLGHEVGDTTVAKYMVRHRSPEKGQSWITFLKNHMDVTAACDFFVVPTLTFKLVPPGNPAQPSQARYHGLAKHRSSCSVARPVARVSPKNGGWLTRLLARGC